MRTRFAPVCLSFHALPLAARLNMTGNLDAFLQCFAEQRGDTGLFAHVDGDSPCLVMPAQHEAVGRLCITDDKDELTFEIGEKYHTHFSAYNYGEDSDRSRMQAAVQDAARFVMDVIADRVCFQVDYVDGHCVSVSSFMIDDESGERDVVRDVYIHDNEGELSSECFLWSGPIEDTDGFVR